MVRYYFKSVIYLIHRWILDTNYLTAYAPKFDLRFKFKTQDVIGRLIFKEGMHEEELTSFLLQNLTIEEQDIIFDVGANIGWYSLLLGKKSPLSVKIYAFEPDPLNFSLLEHNVKINNIKQVICIKKAVSDVEETKILYQYPSKNFGRHSLLPINDNTQIPVETIALDKFIERNNIDYRKIKFMKVDIEGYEYFAFKGAIKVLQHTPFILSEYSPSYMKKGDVSPQALLELFYAHSYTSYLITHDGFLPVMQEEILAKNHGINIFWMKEGYSIL